MKVFRNVRLLLLGLLLVAFLAACGSGDTSDSQSETDATEGATEEKSGDEAEATEGGELNVALNAQPPTMDPMFSTAVATRDVTRLVFETLLTIDSSFQAQPMLAESVESDDNQTYTFKLREGVKFHNGEEMTADDVVASMERWMQLSSSAIEAFGTADFVAVDDYTVTMTLEEPISVTLDIIASPGQAPAIMPKEIAEAAGQDELDEFIGTGPYEFVEWVQDQYIHLSKFDDYSSLDTPSDGMAGKKEAKLDDIYFRMVSDHSTRLAGLQTGEYDLVYQVPLDNFEQVKNDPDLDAEAELVGNLNLVYNKQEGLMSDINMRKAVNAALNLDDVLLAALINDETMLLNSSYMNPQIEHWASDEGSEYYNQNDIELAKQYLDEAGYDGEEIRILTTRDYEYYYSAAVVIKEQLEEAGMKVELAVYDWATVTELREDPNEWELLTNGFTFRSEPSQILEFRSTWAGGVEDEKVEELKKAMIDAETQEEAKEYWDELQRYGWEEFLPVTKLGNYGNVYGAAKNVQGYEIFTGPIIWNAYKTE